MFPIRDDLQSHRFPIVNYLMIGVCILVYVLQKNDADGLVEEFGMVPALVSSPAATVVVSQRQAVRTPFGTQIVVVDRELPAPKLHPWTTLLSCIFLHGSFMHLLGNIWFLYIFGDNVEDRMGPCGYLIFFLGSGIAASLAHFAFQPTSPIPTIGASGAVAGIMGAYMLLNPHAKVVTLIPIFFILQMMVLPAPVFLGIWFVIQLVQGSFSMGSAQAAGVAWWAHAGGFLFGFLVAWFLGRQQHPTRPSVRVINPSDD